MKYFMVQNRHTGLWEIRESIDKDMSLLVTQFGSKARANGYYNWITS